MEHRFRRRFFLQAVGAIILVTILAGPAHSQETVDLETYRKECSAGMTIYCLAAGMQEQKSGNLENALVFYESACENHAAHGNLRSCTPYFSLARQMGRLDEAGSRWEGLCKDGDDVMCFYLAKEYFKITEYHRGFVHLERLCTENFKPPDEMDYGPCYHLGINLKKTGELNRAEKIFSFDCDRDPVSAKPSCDQAEAVTLMIRQGTALDREKVVKWQTIEFAALGITAVPLLSLLLLIRKNNFTLKFLRIAVPVLTVFCWALWEPHAQRVLALRTDLSFIVPAVILALLLAFSAHLSLQDRKRGESAGDDSP